jgi:type I restriction enzyme S subunit
MGISTWKKQPLKILCTRVGDGLHGTPKYSDDKEIAFINGNNLKNGKIVITENTNFVTEEELEKNFVTLNKFSLLLSINGTLGSMAFYDNEKIMLGKSAAYLNFKTDINKFQYYYFQLSEVQKYFYNVATGSTIKNLSLKSIQDFEVPVPEEMEYQQIAKVLSDLDAKIEINNKINQELEAMAKTLYDYWFVQFDFPDKNGKSYKSSGGNMVFNTALKREIPVGWEDGTFETFATIIGGSTPSKAVIENFTKEDNMSWITPKDLSQNKGKKFITRGEWDVTDLGIKSASLNVMPKGTVLLSSRAPIGYLAISRQEVTTNQGFKSFVSKENYSSEFIYYSVKNQIPKIEAYSSGSTFKEVSSSTLKTIKISIPNQEVLNEYYEISKPIFKKQNLLELENQKLSELRDWLLPMLMNGQVTVGSSSLRDTKQSYQESIKNTLGLVAEGDVKYEKN